MNEHAFGGRTYRPDQRPEVWVEVDGDFFDGDLYSWSQGPDGWWALVCWASPLGRHLDSFPAERIHRVDYCPWYRGASECRFGCERGSGQDRLPRPS